MIWINFIDEFCVIHAKLQTIIEILDHRHLIDLAEIIKKLTIPVRSINIEEQTEKSEWLYRVWNPNGQIWYEHNYEHGQKHGLSRSWHHNGQIWLEHNFSNGQKHGMSRGWYYDGKLSYEHNYSNGVKV